MYLNQFESTTDIKLQQILSTLRHVHGINLNFDINTVDGERALLECQQEYEAKKDNIVKESAFNSYQQNPEYIKTMLILEAVRVILKEIAPKRRRSKKVTESLSETRLNLIDALTNAVKTVRDIDLGNDIYGREKLRQALLDIKEIAPSYVKPESKVNNLVQSALKLTSEKVFSPDQLIFYLEKAIAEFKKDHVGEGLGSMAGNWLQTVKNEFEKFWNETPEEEKSKTTRQIAYNKFLRDKEAKKSAETYAKKHPRMEDDNTMKNKENILKLANAMIAYSEKASPTTDEDLTMMNNFSRVGQELLDMSMSNNPTVLSTEDKDIAMYAIRKLKAEGLFEQDQDHDGDEDFADVMISRMTASGMPKNTAIKQTSNKSYNKESTDITEAVDVNQITQQAQHYEYQASMARSELYRNTKYAMSMLHQIDPTSEVTPWIAGALTKAANYLDKIYHYLDYYKNFEPEKLPEDMDSDMELGETSGGVTRQNLMLISEYSIKLFNMIQPGDKLEGWVAMKLTTASECVSSCKHYMDYVQFEKHALDDHFDAGRRATQKKMMEAKQDDAELIGDVNAIELSKAQLILTAKDMSSQIQGMAQDVAKLSVEELMPLVNSMRSLFGPEAAAGFNTVAKDIFDKLLTVTTDTKEKLDVAIDTVNRGGVPSEQSDLESAPEPENEPADDEEMPALDDTSAGEDMPEPGEPLGRAKKEVAESKQAKEPGAVATAQVKKMGKSYWTGKELTKKGIAKRDEIIKSIKKDLKESTLEEKSPPGKDAENWIRSNKSRFIKQYGKKKGMSVLYAKAWDMFGSKSESYQNSSKIVEQSNKVLDKLNHQLIKHKEEFSKTVKEGKLTDPLNIGYGLAGELLIQQINEISARVYDTKSRMLQEMQDGINRMLNDISKNKKADKLVEVKNKTPYGIIYTTSTGNKSKKMFESVETRNYWLNLHNDKLSNVKLIDPTTFDVAIDNILKGE